MWQRANIVSPAVSANAIKSEIKIARWFFVRGRERNWRSSGGEARVATKDDNNINALSTRPSSRERKKSSENEQLVNCSPPGHNRNVSRTRAERVCLHRPVCRLAKFTRRQASCACSLARYGESELNFLTARIYLLVFRASLSRLAVAKITQLATIIHYKWISVRFSPRHSLILLHTWYPLLPKIKLLKIISVTTISPTCRINILLKSWIILVSCAVSLKYCRRVKLIGDAL